MSRIAGRAFASVLFCLLGSHAWGQSATLTLGSIPGSITTTVPLALSGGANPAALQWTLTYPGSVQSVTVTAGPAATAAGKAATCLPSTGRLTCLLFGLNRNTIANGVIANIKVTAGISMPPNPLAFTAVAAVSMNGSPILAQTAVTPVPSTSGVASLSCTPTVFTGAATATCSVALAAKTTSTVSVSVTSNNANVKVPLSVSVAAGASGASFTATVSAVTGADQQAVISASLGASTSSAVLTLSGPATLAGLACSPSSIAPGGASICTLSLTKAAPAAGFAAALISSSAAVSIPASVTVTAGSLTAQFTAAASSSAMSGVTTVTARVSSSTQNVSTPLTIAVGYQITSFACTPSSLIPGGTAQCLVNLSSEAPSGGLVAAVSSSSSNVTVPSSVNIPATASIFQFSASASAQATAETATLTLTVQSVTGTAKIDVNPDAAFYLQGNKVEITSLTNGATVQPTAGPANWTGKFAVKGSGYMAFDDVSSGNGLVFQEGGSQNVNTAFISFSGQQVGAVFKPQGEVKFLLKSSYSFAQRQLLPQPSIRYIFDVYDDTRPHFAFYTYTSGGALTFAYTTGGWTTAYTLPAGQEDKLFGAGVIADIRITWTNNSSTLYLNGQAVKTITFAAMIPNWSSQSNLTIGSHNARVLGGGYYACDDAVADFQVR